jgi:hypothetical protein
MWWLWVVEGMGALTRRGTRVECSSRAGNSKKKERTIDSDGMIDNDRQNSCPIK